MKLLKRILSLGLAASLLAAVLPSSTAFANIQSNISNLTIVDVPTSANDVNDYYSFNLNWVLPNSWSTVSDTSARDGDVQHAPVGYKIEEFDATDNKGDFEEIDSVSGANTTSATEKRYLENGRIFNYRVLPYHYHSTESGQKTVLPDKTRCENVLYMSDLAVDAEIGGNRLTVRWDDPKFKGTRVFNKYKIYYIRGDNPALVSFGDGAVQVDVSVGDATPIEGDTRLSYTIEDEEIIDGEFYAVKVEPMYENSLLRNVSGGLGYKNVRIGGTNYKMAFRDMVTHEYRTAAASKIVLDYVEVGGEYVNLKWAGISNTAGNVQRIDVLMYDAEEISEADANKNKDAEKITVGEGEDISYRYYLFNDESVIGRINSASATYISTWKTEMPKKLKGYKIRVYVEGKSDPIESNYVVLPEETLIAPNSPKTYLAYNANSDLLNVSWEVAKRYPYTADEQAEVDEEGLYTDYDVVYDIWLTDEYINFSSLNMPPVVQNYSVSASDLVAITEENDLGFTLPLDSYYTVNADGAFELVQGIKGNVNYYVKIVAKNAKNTDYVSDPSYATVYVNTRDDISKPPALSKPPLEVDDSATTADTLKVQWDSEWYEVYDSETDDWYSKVSVDDGGNLLFGDNADPDNTIKFYNAVSEERAREILEQNGVGGVTDLTIRKIDLSELELDQDIKYEIVYKPVSDVYVQGGYLAYVDKLIKSDATDWIEFTPQSDGKHYSYVLNPLNPDTTYVIIVRAYRINSSGQKEAYPAFVLGYTKNLERDIDITPTVPIVEEVETGDTYFTIKWEEHIPNLDYEIAINETNLDDPTKASIIANMEDINANGKKYAENGYNYINYTQNDLFPSTGYYVWVRSIAPNGGRNAVTSVWSNALYIETKALQQPDPPTGLGLISSADLAIFNRANSTSYIPIDYNYFIVQWNKNYYDNKILVAETKDGSNFEVFENEEVKNRITVLMKELTANTDYYVRAKTVHIVRKLSGGGGSGGSKGSKSESVFTYVLQVAPTDDFKDATEIVVPIAIPEKTASAEKVYVIESEWCDEIKLITEPSDNEYDADKDPDLYPLPTEDYEILYNGSTGEIIYRFRSNEEDADGNDDNGVDQRFISRLIQNHTFTYTVDLTNYNGNYIKTRTLEIPYSIISALDERKINLELVANNITVTFPPEFLRTSDVINRYDYGMGTKVTLSVVEKPDGLPTLNYNQSYLSIPQSVSAVVKTPSTVINVKNTAKPVTVALKTENRYDAVDSNVSAYYNDNTADKLWNRVDSSFDNASGMYSFQTGKLDTYTVLAVSAPTPTGNNQEAIGNVGTFQSKINITDVSSFNPQKAVSAVEFNNVAAAIAAGRKDVELHSALSTEDTMALQRKGILVSGSVVSRQQAVKSLMALYEARNKTRMTYYSSLATTPYADIASADPAYQTAMLKAGDLGFFDTSNGARPKDVISLNELLYMADIILEDTNY